MRQSNTNTGTCTTSITGTNTGEMKDRSLIHTPTYTRSSNMSIPTSPICIIDICILPDPRGGWWSGRDSNPQPRPYEGPAPPLSYRTIE